MVKTIKVKTLKRCTQSFIKAENIESALAFVEKMGGGEVIDEVKPGEYNCIFFDMDKIRKYAVTLNN